MATNGSSVRLLGCCERTDGRPGVVEEPEGQKRRTESIVMKGEGEPGFRNTQNLLEDIVSVGK